MTDTGSAELKYRRYIQKKRITPPAEEKAIGEPEEDSKNVFKPEPETRSFPGSLAGKGNRLPSLQGRADQACFGMQKTGS